MKNLSLLLILFLFTILFSCQPETESEETDRPNLTTVDFGGMELYVDKTEDGLIHQGDILIPKTEPVRIYNKGEAPKSAGRTSGLWPDNIVHYAIDPNLSNKQRIYDAIDHWEKKSNLQFVKRTNERAYIYFKPGTGCSSYIGRLGYKQSINLARGCTTGNTIHEIGHAVGLWHEQSRADRDQHIIVHYDNVQDDREYNFLPYSSNYPSEDWTSELDFGSIMMYHPYSFSKNGEPTITKLDGSIYKAQRYGLSDGDVEGINKMYPNEKKEPEYENGNFYALYGLTVLRYYDSWYYKHFRLGFKQVEAIDGIWYWK